MTAVDLSIDGMTCAACAQRIERKLNKLPGVSATVNYATERAHVVFPETVSPEVLEQTVAKAGYQATQIVPTAPEPGSVGLTETRLRSRLKIAATLTLPVVLLGMIPPLQFAGWQWVSFGLATPVVTWSAWPFHRSALINLRQGAFTMDTLVSLGVSAAYLWSVVALVFGTAGHWGMQHTFDWRVQAGAGLDNVYFEAATAITSFLLLGRWIERKARTHASAALRRLAALEVGDVVVLHDGQPRTVPRTELQVNDLFLVRTGERVATDGVVEAGGASINASMLTGESLPVLVGIGDEVIGGTVNTDGQLSVRATEVGATTVLGQISALVERAQTGKAAVQRLADRVSGVFVPMVLLAAAVTCVSWFVAGASPAFALGTAVAVLIVACPCALGLATPTALVVGTGRGAQYGILVGGPEALEASSKLDAVCLDKTGTLTTGVLSVTQIETTAGVAASELITMAAAAEQSSAHPVGRSIVSIGPKALPAASDVSSVAGQGVRATVEQQQVIVGTKQLLADSHLNLPLDLIAKQEELESTGHSVVFVGWGGLVRGLIATKDTLRPTSAQAIADFKNLGIQPILATGDNGYVAHEVAHQVGIEVIHAGLSPAEKLAVVRGLQAKGSRVAMVGDGINDAAALAGANLGIAMGSGTDVARAASDLTLLRSDVSAAVAAVQLARSTLGTIKVNLVWAFGYNVAALPLAAFGYLNPMIAGAAMVLSSLFVVGNSLRLRTWAP
jgi:P-type Cu+ transporter